MLLPPFILKPCTPAGESQPPFLLTWSGRPREVVQCPGDKSPCSCRGSYFLSETPHAVLVLLSRGPGSSRWASQRCFPRLLQHECHVRNHCFTFLQQKHFQMARLPWEGVVFLNDLRGSNIFYRKCPQMHVVILCLRQTVSVWLFFLVELTVLPLNTQHLFQLVLEEASSIPWICSDFPLFFCCQRRHLYVKMSLLKILILKLTVTEIRNFITLYFPCKELLSQRLHFIARILALFLTNLQGKQFS